MATRSKKSRARNEYRAGFWLLILILLPAPLLIVAAVRKMFKFASASPPAVVGKEGREDKDKEEDKDKKKKG